MNPKPRKRQPANISTGFWRLPAGRVAAGLLVLAVVAVLAGGASLFFNVRQEAPAPQSLAQVAIENAIRIPPVIRVPPLKRAEMSDKKEIPKKVEPLSRDPGARLPETQAWLKNAVAAAVPNGRPMIAVVIDDVGLDRSRSRRAIALPAPVTIALMAYAEDGRDQAAHARQAGHELLVHLPMEPGDPNENPGPNALVTGLAPAEFARRLEWGLSQFAGYVGINNHMGSKLTSNPSALAPVMAALKKRGLMFLDSRTSGETQALAVARHFGVPAVERNVFLDHDISPIAVRTALARVEDLARQNGFAIAIGHPKDVTLDALEEWLPDVKARGFAVVPLTAVVRYGADAG